MSFSKDKAGGFQAQFLGVILGRKFLAVSHASSLPSVSQSKHMCCSLSRISIFFFILKNEQNALLAHPGILFQKDPHFILPDP